MTRKWEGWEYAILSQSIEIGEKAAHLGRSEEEVARQFDRDYTGTLASWYRYKRSPGSPPEVSGIVEAASRLLNTKFPELLDEQCVETYVFEVLNEVFQYFDPKRGNPRVPVERRFMKVFLNQLRRRLNRHSLRLKVRKKRLMPRLPERPERTSCQDEEAFNFWAHQLFWKAVQRLPRKVRRCIEMRCEGRSSQEIARVIGVTAKTVANVYHLRGLAEMVKHEVRGMVLELPGRHLRLVVAHLLFGEELSQTQAERLLCVPGWVMDGAARAVEKENTPVVGREQALQLVGGGLREDRVA